MHTRNLALLAVVVGFGLAVGYSVGFTPPADASRNSAGTYALPAGNPVVSGTAISSTVHNATMSDIATELTNSLDRSGRGAMTAPLQLSSGTVALPGLTFSGDTDSGLYRVGANDVAISASATKSQEWTASGTTVPGTLGVSQAVTFSSTLAVVGATTITSAATLNGGVTSTGPSATAGGTFTGGATSGKGIVATGTGSGVGGQFTGGATGDGLVSTGGGSTKSGVLGTGGSGGVGGYFVAGTAGTATTQQNAIVASAGNIAFSGTTNLNSNIAVSNTVTPKNTIKAWGKFTFDGTGGVTVTDGFNISSTSLASPTLTVTMASAMTSTGYAVVCSGNLSQINAGASSTTQFAFTSTGGCTLGGCAQNVSCMVIGAQ